MVLMKKPGRERLCMLQLPELSLDCALLCLVTQLCLTLCDHMDCSPLGSSVLGILQARLLEWVAMPSSRGDLPNPGIERSPALQAASLPSEPPGKPKNGGVGSLSLLQGIFPTQELKWDMLHCRHFFYQLSYQGSPKCLYIILMDGAFKVVLVVKNPPANAGDVNDPSSVPGSEDFLEEGMATHSSILAWRIPRNRETWWAPKESMGSQTVRHD